MAASFSPYALEMMGFREAIAEGQIRASFMSFTIYEAIGVDLMGDYAEAYSGKIAGTEYRVAISSSVNAACNALTGELFIDSESAWLEELKARGPFVVVGVGPTEFYPCNPGRSMIDSEGSIHTYDCFPEVRKELTAREQRTLPLIISSLTFSLSDAKHKTHFRKIAETLMGRTQDLVPLHDTQLKVKMHISSSRRIDQSAVRLNLAEATEMASLLHPKAAQFFFLGTSESDQLKKFLYFFLALEIETHTVFKRINHDSEVARIIKENDQSPSSIHNLFKNQAAKLSNLYDRFVWCVSCVWTDLKEADISLFKELKIARDAIAHGDASMPPPGYASSAETLVRKVVWRRHK